MWSKIAEIIKTNKQMSPYGTNSKKRKTLRKPYKKQKLFKSKCKSK